MMRTMLVRSGKQRMEKTKTVSMMKISLVQVTKT
jgi:hypothetical protein